MGREIVTSRGIKKLICFEDRRWRKIKEISGGKRRKEERNKMLDKIKNYHYLSDNQIKEREKRDG
jgi:hypothetical protein